MTLDAGAFGGDEFPDPGTSGALALSAAPHLMDQGGVVQRSSAEGGWRHAAGGEEAFHFRQDRVSVEIGLHAVAYNRQTPIRQAPKSYSRSPTDIGICWPMPTPKEAQDYLGAALEAFGVDLATASRAIGRNHAYLQQYVRYGKPAWLKEQDRDTLVLLYDLEVSRLQPPPKVVRAPLSSDDRKQSQADAPKLGKVIKDPGALELLDIYADIEGDDARTLAKRVLRGFTRNAANRTG